MMVYVCECGLYSCSSGGLHDRGLHGGGGDYDSGCGLSGGSGGWWLIRYWYSWFT